jgi:tetratricopeptide (TPR) repeat protein
MSKIIDTSEPVKKQRLHPKTLVAIGTAIVVLITVGGLIFTNQQNKLKTAKTDEYVKYPEAVAHDKATELAAKSEGEALKYYDDEIASASSSAAKVELLLGKASVAYNSGDFDGALKAAKDADAVKSSTGTLRMIAESYEAKGDKANALEFYKKALAALPKSDITNRESVSLKSKIDELSKS